MVNAWNGKIWKDAFEHKKNRSGIHRCGISKGVNRLSFIRVY
jgi:hypothetical protein